MPATSPTFLVPGERIDLSDSEAKTLGGFLRERVVELHGLSRSLFSDIPIWWKWYYAEPAVAEKNFPFKRASNIVVPLVRTLADADTAITFGKIFAAAPRVWSVSSTNEEPLFQDFARSWDEHMRYAPEHDFGLKVPVHDTIQESRVIGTSVMALNWHRDERHIFHGFARGKKMATQKVQWSRGVAPVHVPREFILWDTAYEIHDAPIVARQHGYAQWQLEAMAAGDPAWRRESIARISGSGSAAGGGFADSGAAEISRVKDSYEGRSRPAPHTQEQYSTIRDIREIHFDFPVFSASGLRLPGSDKLDPYAPWIPLVAHIDYKTGELLRLVASPYHIPTKPFYSFHYRKMPGRGNSVGIAKRQWQMQEMQSTTINQMNDSATRMNAMWGITNDLKLSKQIVDLSRPMYSPNVDSFRELNINTTFPQNMPLLQAAQVIAERDAGIADPLLGRETRHGGHSAPATSTLALMGQQEKMTIASDELLRDTMSRLGRDITILYQQYETNEDGKYDVLHGQKDAAHLKPILFPDAPIPVNFIFDVAAMSPNMNPDSEMRRATIVNQMTNDYWGFILPILQTISANPNLNPKIIPMVLQAIESKTATYEKLLEASNIDDIERFVLTLKSASNPEQLRDVAGIAGQVVQGAGAAPGPQPNGGVPGSSQGGAGSIAPAGSLV